MNYDIALAVELLDQIGNATAERPFLAATSVSAAIADAHILPANSYNTPDGIQMLEYLAAANLIHTQSVSRNRLDAEYRHLTQPLSVQTSHLTDAASRPGQASYSDTYNEAQTQHLLPKQEYIPFPEYSTTVDWYNVSLTLLGRLILEGLRHR
jgi:hypothetical protein